MVDLGEIARAIGDEYLRTHRTTPFQRKALRAIQRCRTEAMGLMPAVCEGCGAEYPLYRSCRNRHCPGCQKLKSAEWLEDRKEELLPVPYFHVVFTVPDTLNPIALYCPEVFYAALLRAAGRTLLDVGRTKMHALLGCLAVLHTWGQTMWLHPHAHCVVPGGGFSVDGKRWVPLRNPKYLLPVEVLWRRFRTLLCLALRQAAQQGRLERLPDEVSADQLIKRAWKQKWIAYVKPPFAGPEQVLAYVSRYTHRIAMSNSRIQSFAEGKITFKWRDYADGNRIRTMTLEAEEFLRRFLMHVLPDRFVRIRYFGFLSHQQRPEKIKLARTLMGGTTALQFGDRVRPVLLCPACRAAISDTPQDIVQRSGTVRPPPGAEEAA